MTSLAYESLRIASHPILHLTYCDIWSYVSRGVYSLSAGKRLAPHTLSNRCRSFRDGSDYGRLKPEWHYEQGMGQELVNRASKSCHLTSCPQACP